MSCQQRLRQRHLHPEPPAGRRRNAGQLAGDHEHQHLLLPRGGKQLRPCAAQGFTQATAYPINFFRPNPYASNLSRTTSDINTNYNGLQIELRKALSHGLQFQFSYVWSHTLGGISNLDNQSATDQWQTLRNGRLDYGPTPFDRRHNFTTFWTWQLPIGKGRWIGVNNPLLDRVVGGWSLGGIHRFISGSPGQLTSGRNSFNQFADSGVVFGSGLTPQQLMNRLGSAKTEYIASCQCFLSDVADISLANGTADPRYYARGATLGMIGPTTYVHGRWDYQNDLSLTKEVRITEKLTFGVQALALAVFNPPVPRSRQFQRDRRRLRPDHGRPGQQPPYHADSHVHRVVARGEQRFAEVAGVTMRKRYSATPKMVWMNWR